MFQNQVAKAFEPAIAHVGTLIKLHTGKDGSKTEIWKGNSMDEATWLQLRMLGIGGSDIGAVVGMSPYSTALDVYEQKLGLAPPKPMNMPMLLGRLMEPIVAALYEMQEGVKLFKPGFQRHPVHPWVLGTPDRLVVGQRKGVELKTTAAHNARRWGEAGGDEVPEEHTCQSHWYMPLVEMDAWDVAVLIGGSDFRIYHLYGDQRFERALFDHGDVFWHEHVLRGIPPVLSPEDLAKTDLAARFPRDKDARLLTAGEELLPWIDALERLIPEHKRLEKEIERAKMQLKAAIGDHAGLRGHWGTVSWTANADGRKTDWQRLARFLGATPELIKAFTEDTPGSRVFRTQFNGRSILPEGGTVA